MTIKNLCVYAGLCAGVASMAFGQGQGRQLQLASAGKHVEPVQIAKVRMEDGKVVFQSDWMEYQGGTTRVWSTRVFDCIGDCDSDGVPDDCHGCGMGNSKWYFGSTFCNLFWTNDMVTVDDVVVDAGFGRADFAWYWTAGGSGTSEPCVIALFTQEAEHDNMCVDGDTFDYSGWLLDFGPLASSVGGGYYYTNVDIGSTGTWPCPSDGIGSYSTIYSQGVTTSGAFVMATCAQPMLWATGDDGGTWDVIGTQDVLQLDEVVVDLFHDVATECFSYSFTSVCPSILGGMMQFWGERGIDCYADCNFDGYVNIQDFLCYLGLWAAEDPAADCDNDGDVGVLDFLCFLGLWSAGC